jgi:multidrug efflux pump subunit AcrB
LNATILNAPKQYSFINDKGQTVYLNQFADVKLASGPNSLERRNKQASIIILSQVIGRPVGDIGVDIKKVADRISLPQSVKISYEGDLELQDDSFGSLGMALLISFLLIYLIMVVLYNNWTYPFVVLFSIPVAMVAGINSQKPQYFFNFWLNYDDGAGSKKCHSLSGQSK